MKPVPHPNATIAAGTGFSVGALVWELGQLAGWEPSPIAILGIASAGTWIVVAVGRIGMVGIWDGLMHGFKNSKPNPSKPPVEKVAPSG